MSELTTEQLIKIIIGVLVFVAVVAGVYLFFRFNVIGFFKGYTDEEQPAGQIGGTNEETAKTYKINNLGFKIGDKIVLDKEVVKTGVIEFVVLSETNCERTEYQVWLENILTFVKPTKENKYTLFYAFDVKKSEKISLIEVNILLNQLPAGKYHVDCFCFDNKGKSTKLTSKNLEVISSAH
jgi:hypothetical protein